MTFESLTESDIGRLVPFFIYYYNTYEDSEWAEATAARRIRQVVTREDSLGLLLIDDDEIIGFVMGYLEQYDDGLVYDLVEIVIAKERQGQGLGTLLINEIERKAAEAGAFMAQLDSVNDEEHDRFYTRLGYGHCENLIMMSKAFSDS